MYLLLHSLRHFAATTNPAGREPEQPRHQPFELSHRPAYALSKLATEAPFDNLSPDWLIDPRRARIMWCLPHVERTSGSIEDENEIRGRPFTVAPASEGRSPPPQRISLFRSKTRN